MTWVLHYNHDGSMSRCLPTHEINYEPNKAITDYRQGNLSL